MSANNVRYIYKANCHICRTFTSFYISENRLVTWTNHLCFTIMPLQMSRVMEYQLISINHDPPDPIFCFLAIGFYCLQKRLLCAHINLTFIFVGIVIKQKPYFGIFQFASFSTHFPFLGQPRESTLVIYPLYCQC